MKHVESAQDVETCGNFGESETKEPDKEEAEHEGKTKVVRRVPPKYNRDRNVQEVSGVAKSKKNKAKASGRPKECAITEKETITNS